MKRILFVIIFSLIFTYWPFNFSQANVEFSNIEVTDIVNGRAKLKWTTNANTKAEIYYGNSENNLNRFMGYSVFSRQHETILSGLEKANTYYYKIKAIEENGEITETFVKDFSTKYMEDTIKPDFGEVSFLQITNNAVAIRWETNEKTRGTIYYGTSLDALSKKVYYRKYRKLHDTFIYKLKAGEKYYFKIKARDEDDNFREKTINTNLRSSGSSDLKIFDIKPLSSDSELIKSRTAIIQWKTSLISKGIVYYGDNRKKIRKKVYDSPRKLNHEIKIEDLIPNKTYYFKIKSYDSLYNKRKTSDIFSFKTKSLESEHRVGSLVKGSGPKVYVIKKNAKKAWIKNEDVFLGLGYKWSMIENVSDQELSEYEDDGEVSSIKKHPEGTLIKYADSDAVYMIDNGKKRPFYTGKAFSRRGYKFKDIIIISNKEKYKRGKEIF